MLRHGKTKFEFAEDAKTSRNTLDKLLAGHEVRTTTVAGILAALEGAEYDTRELRALMYERSAPSEREQAVRTGTVALAVDNAAQSETRFAILAVQNLELAEAALIQLERSMKSPAGADPLSQQTLDDVEYIMRRVNTVFEGVERRMKKRLSN